VNQAVRAILKSLPATRRRSKLEPHAALIHALRRRGRTYREIVRVLRERCGVTVAVHTLHHFLRMRSQAQTAASSRTRIRTRTIPTVPPNAAATARVPETTDDVRRRIAALKAREPTTTRAEPKPFVYDDTEPLQLIPPHPGKEK
jgi:hypothetical protein